LSPIFAELILVGIVVICGAVAYASANNIISANTSNYAATVQNDQNALSERIGFENVAYDAASNTITVSIVNCGSANDLRIQYLFLYNVTSNQHQLIGYFADPVLMSLDESVAGNGLNILKEAYFDVDLGCLSPPFEMNLSPGTVYIVHLITQRGSSSDYTFAT
jgi:hypothetical protein